MKNTLICPKCNENRILYVDQVADALGPGRQPMVIAEQHGFLGPKAVGELSAGVCRACGYTEFYVKEPGAIEPDGKFVKELVGPPRPGPYRD